MVRRLLFSVIVAVLLLCLPVRVSGDNSLAVWLMGDYNQTGVRVAHVWDDSFELGLQSYWWLWEDVDPPQTYGLYGLYHFPGEIDISKIPLLDIFQGQLNMASYLGFQGAIELQGGDGNKERGYIGPLAGLVLDKFIFDEVDDLITTGTEVQYVNYVDQWEDDIKNDEVRVAFFLRIAF